MRPIDLSPTVTADTSALSLFTAEHDQLRTSARPHAGSSSAS